MNRASLFFHISVQINVSSTINMQTNGSIKSLPCRGILLSVYELMKLRVLTKWTLKWPLNQEVIFLILIVLSCPWEFSFFWAVKWGEFFHQLILPVALTPAWFLEGQSRKSLASSSGEFRRQPAPWYACGRDQEFWRNKIFSKNPAYGRQSISRPMRIVAPMP